MPSNTMIIEEKLNLLKGAWTMPRYRVDVGHIRDFVEDASSEEDAIAQEIAELEHAIQKLRARNKDVYVYRIPDYGQPKLSPKQDPFA